MNDRALKKAIRTAAYEWNKWMRNPRVLIVGFLVLVVMKIAVEPLKEKADMMNSAMNIFEPLLAVGNSSISVLLIPAVYVLLMSDFPAVEPNAMFYFSRTGKKPWFFGQLMFASLSVITFMTVFSGLVVLGSIKGADISLKWSDGTRLYAARFPQAIGNFAHRLLPSNLYNQMSAGKALAYTLSLLSLYLLLLSMVLLVFGIYGQRKMGIITVYTLMLAGIVCCNLSGSVKWLFPMSHSIIWLHFTEVLRKPIMPPLYSYLYLSVTILALAVIGFFGLRRMNFDRVDK